MDPNPQTLKHFGINTEGTTTLHTCVRQQSDLYYIYKYEMKFLYNCLLNPPPQKYMSLNMSVKKKIQLAMIFIQFT